MKLTIEQVLQKSMVAHQEGKFQDAERLYQVLSPSVYFSFALSNILCFIVGILFANAQKIVKEMTLAVRASRITELPNKFSIIK